MERFISAIILAGGAGERFERDIPKQFMKVAGRMVIEYTLESFQKSPRVKEIIIVNHAHYMDHILDIVKKNKFDKVKGIVIGGATRQQSSYIGLNACNEKSTHVLIHDAARPFISGKIIEDIISGFAQHDAIDTVIPTADTIVQIDRETHIIRDIPERSTLKRGQTPQAFKIDIIKEAHRRAIAENINNSPDDCNLVLKYDLTPIGTVAGDEANIKITYPLDIYIADRIFQLRRGYVDVKSGRDISTALKKKVAVIFGGTGGIGKSIADILKIAGVKVFAFGKEKNILDFAGVSQALAEIYRREQMIDIVVNTVGKLNLSLIEHHPIEEIKGIIEINLLGSIGVAKAAIPYLKKSQGHMVLFTSSSYTRGREAYTPYSASKAALVNFVQGFAEEVLDYGIKVNAINPERTGTPMRFKNFGKEDETMLLKPEAVAIKTINLFLTDITGQVIDVRKEEEEEIFRNYGWQKK
jgi:2-C-methyl-D-erythritol 4-phosphate cytidylyltransferase